MDLSIQALEEAVAIIFQNNFDAESKVCLVTLMKLLDNILHQPGNEKVRSIRLANPAFHSKVGCRKGGIDFLKACGFVQQESPVLLSSAIESILQLQNEKQSHLITARRLLMTRAIHDLGCKAEELPAYRPPPLPDAISDSSSAVFNPFISHRYDAQSAAVGENLGPDKNYVSKTETELQKLKKQQALLEAKMHNVDDHEWRVFPPPTAASVPSMQIAETTVTESSRSDLSLLAARAVKQQQHAPATFTTKAMRDLELMKKARVYSHVTLTIHFPDGCRLQGKFLPKDKVRLVIDAVRRECLIEPAITTEFQLYITPPRKQLAVDNSLQEEGLVPAAKVFVSWKTSLKPSAASAAVSQPGFYLRQELWEQRVSSEVAFPSAQPIADVTGASKQESAIDDKPSTVENKMDKEDELLRRMMGGGLGTKRKEKSNSTDKSSNSASAKPKWFKG